MTKITKQNPYNDELLRVDAEQDALSRRQKELYHERIELQQKAKKWERKNSPIKDIGKELLDTWSEKSFRDQVKSVLNMGSDFVYEPRPGWILKFYVKDKKYSWTSDIYYQGLVSLTGPDGQTKRTQDDLGTSRNVNILLREIKPWLQRMAERG